MVANHQKTPRSRNWLKENMERLVCWMEENQQSLCGKQSVWHKDVKEQVFAKGGETTMKQIGEKVQNMENAWGGSHKLQDQSGEGVRSEDNALLESKCPLFWRLGGIWGTRPNTTPIAAVDPTPSDLPASAQAPPPPSPTEDSDDEKFE